MQVVDERNDVHNQLLDVPNLQGQSSTLFQRTTLSSSNSGLQVIRSRIMGLSGTASLVQMPESTRLLRYDHRNNQYNSQAMMPDGHVEQGVGDFIQLSGRSTRVISQGNDEQNQLLDAQSFQGQGTAMYQPTTLPTSLSASQATGSRNMGHLGFRINDQTSSQVRVSETRDLLSLIRQERASNIQLQQVAPPSANRPTIWKNWKGKNGEEYVPPRRGRPRKRFEVGESSKCPKQPKIEKDLSGTENAGPTSIQEEANNASENESNEVQNANPTSPSAPTPRDIANGLYSVTFEMNGVPIDPYLRLFKGPPGNYDYFIGIIFFFFFDLLSCNKSSIIKFYC
ncbi:hypothetical protein Lal_00020012 [Lupinus albus]|nr:hypothetical protein Lal_00020012 [Lupinus albus]